VTLRRSCACRGTMAAIAAAERINANADGFMLLQLEVGQAAARRLHRASRGIGRSFDRPRSFYVGLQGVGYFKLTIECELRWGSYDGHEFV
jgi:hypothetical protein